MTRRSVLVDDNPHRDAARGADRRAIVIGVERPLLVHTATLARGSFRQPSPSDAGAQVRLLVAMKRKEAACNCR